MNRSHSKPFFIIEGPDGAGKSTLIEHLIEALNVRGYDVDWTRQPGGTPTGERFRDLLLDPKIEMTAFAQVHVFYASREQALTQRLLPALDSGKIVISDRFELSTLAYQTASIRQEYQSNLGVSTESSRLILESIKHLNRINHIAMDGLNVRYIILDAPDEVLDARRPGQVGDRYEDASRVFKRDVRSYYRDWLRANEGRPTVLSLDGTKPLDELTARALEFIRSHYEDT